jgi:hypothetical protein
MAREPTTELHPEFSSPGATAVPWSEARDRLTLAEIFWISTVRPDARPHVTPLVAVWLDDALFFVTEETERKATNLTYNPHAVMTTGCAAFRDGFDIVIEGDAIRATGESILLRVPRRTPRSTTGTTRFATGCSARCAARISQRSKPPQPACSSSSSDRQRRSATVAARSSARRAGGSPIHRRCNARSRSPRYSFSVLRSERIDPSIGVRTVSSPSTGGRRRSFRPPTNVPSRPPGREGLRRART